MHYKLKNYRYQLLIQNQHILEFPIMPDFRTSKFIKKIYLPIFYQNTRIQASVNLFLLKTEVETSFLLSFDAYVGSLDRLTHSEDAINYILNTGMGTYCNYKIPYNTHWIAIYFNNVNPILLLDLI
jgi:hypothetical protein